MTRRQKKKRFKRKWLNGHHAVFLRTVPNKWKASWADKVNEIFEDEVTKRMDAAILYGTGQTASGIPYCKPRVYQSGFCVSCENRDGDPIFAACSVCRADQNGRPTHYRGVIQMKKKTIRKMLKEQRKQRAQAQTPEILLPAEFKDRIVSMFLTDPGCFAGDPREFA